MMMARDHGMTVGVFLGSLSGQQLTEYVAWYEMEADERETRTRESQMDQAAVAQMTAAKGQAR